MCQRGPLNDFDVLGLAPLSENLHRILKSNIHPCIWKKADTHSLFFANLENSLRRTRRSSN